MESIPKFLTDPFLQRPTPDQTHVVWFTDFAGHFHEVLINNDSPMSYTATTHKLSRSREDAASDIPHPPATPQLRDIWRHEAQLPTPVSPVPYQVRSVTDTGETIISESFTLPPVPLPDQPLNILLTSDHQLKPMTAANVTAAYEKSGPFDAVFFAGDLVNVPDRASEWFDSQTGNAFFPVLQGNARYHDPAIQATYRGAPILQNTPIYPAIGNHEVMGRYSDTAPLNEQIGDPQPRHIAEANYAQQNDIHESESEARQKWIRDHSYNAQAYEDIFSLPTNSPSGEHYYATTIGNIRLIVLYVCNVWRTPEQNPDVTGRYQESREAIANPDKRGYGQLIFEPITPGSNQYQWLVDELNSESYQNAKYKIVMFHHPPHSIGFNITPPYTTPREVIERDDEGKVTSITYRYPQEDDYITKHLVPLFNQHDVHLVYYGHSHLWNRFQNEHGVNFLESSNVGNSYGAYLGESKRPVDDLDIPTGNPNGLDPIVPSLAPLCDADGSPLPYISSNTITVFSVLNTKSGTVASYRYDTTTPTVAPIIFDEFPINARR